MDAHQPFPVALIAVQVEMLDCNGLRVKARSALIINEALVHGPEPALTKKVG